MTTYTMTEAQREQLMTDADAAACYRLLQSLQPNTQEPVERQFQSPDGRWHSFLDGEHYANTVADGNWPIRELFTHPAPHQLDALQDIAAFISVGGYNGATPEQLTQRIKDEFVRLIQQPPTPQQKSLTDEQIQEIWNVASGSIPGWCRHITYARAIEAAHNIGVKP